MRYFLVFLTFIFIAQANELENTQDKIPSTTETINVINSMNKGIKRDFYINEYFKKDITKDEALNALSLVNNLSNDMFYNFAKKFKHDETLAVAQCMNMDIKELIDSYADCIVIGLSLKDVSTLSSIDLDLIMQKTSQKYPLFTKRLKVFSSSIPFTKLIVLEKDEFYNIFLNVSDDFRAKYFDYKLPKRTFEKIFIDKSNFEKFLQVSLSDLRLKNLQKSLFEIDDSKLDANSSFLLALNAIRLNDSNKAMIYLNNSWNKAKNTETKDKVIFWKYLVTKDESYLIELSNSLNLDLYSVYANELLKKELEDFNFLRRIDSFDSLLEEYDINRVSLLYSLAKVKSDFNANKISKNFELGLMQLDYKLIDKLSKTIPVNNDSSFDLFNLENNLKLANIHLNSIENSLTNPIFLSLSYEGNSKYLNKKLTNGLFSKKSLFEPFMSLELISNDKYEYLKDILMYKYLYQNYLTKKKKDKITLSSIFENLPVSSQK